MRPRLRPAFLVAALAAILLLSGCSLAGDVTPPPGSSVGLPQQASSDLGVGFPLSRPSAANGALLYAAHCAQCHGAGGRGDGEMAAQLQFPPADFTDPSIARRATPAQWYAMVTQGNLERFMPPFVNSLSEAERWDAVAYLYTLGTPSDVLETGQAVYDAECAACHGESGAGDGPEADAAHPPSDFGNLERMASVSQTDLFNAINAGTGEAMPGFADTLTEDDRWAVAAVVRAFTFDNVAVVAAPPEAGQTAPEGEAETASAQGAVTGLVTNGTLGAPVGSGLQVVLYGFDGFQLASTFTETVQADGTFSFPEVPYQDGRSFILTTQYNGISYASDLYSFEGGVSPLEIPLSVYDTTTDPSGLQIDRLHIFFDFSPGSATVGELLLISNTGNETVLGGVALQFDLPEGATNLRIDGLAEGEDYVATAQGFTLTRPVPPGMNAAQLLVSFFLPYDRTLDFSQTLPFPANAVNVLVPDVGVRATGSQLQDQGAQDVQGMRVLNYSVPGLPAGQPLSFRLSGRVSGEGGVPALAVDTPGLIVGGLTLAVVLGGVGWWYYSRTRSQAPVAPAAPRRAQPDDRETLLRQIAALDDEHAAGRVAEADYHRRRAALKARLLKVWNQ